MIKKKRKHFTKLGWKFLGVVVVSIFLSLLLFQIFYLYRSEILNFVVGEDVLQQSTYAARDEMQRKVDMWKLSVDDEKMLRRIFRRYPTMNIQVYKETGEQYFDYIGGRGAGSSFAGSHILLNIYTPTPYTFPLECADGTLEVTVLSYGEATLVLFYLFGAGMLCVGLFVLNLVLFIRRKMRYILQVEEGMSLLEAGDYSHVIACRGNDEITSLARQMNSLCQTLKENIEKEEQAKRANQELVTAMSHDLRTPLTSLLGYLDILQMKIYTSEAERDSYIDKSRSKAEQIKELSDRLFNHFLLYAQDEDYTLQPVSSDTVNQLLEAQCEDLLGERLILHLQMDEKPYVIEGETSLLKRVMDNLFSNIRKYAADGDVWVRLSVEPLHVVIEMKNWICPDTPAVESSRIGLKSVAKMMQAMKGEMYTTVHEGMFIVRLIFPHEVQWGKGHRI